MLSDFVQTYMLTVVAMDGGQPRRSSSATVTVNIVSDNNLLPPQWQQVNGDDIDDLTDVFVSEDAAVNTVISNVDRLRLVATATGQQQVQ